jgi:beta-glucosidase
MKKSKFSNPIRQKKQSALLPYKDPNLTAEKRVADLLSRMTLEEKAAQMVGIWRKKYDTFVDAAGAFDREKALASFCNGHGRAPGQIGRPSDTGQGLNTRQMVEFTNTIQRFFVENSRLGIPVLIHEECLHGHAARDATSFPQPIALAATFSPELLESVFTATAAEARVRGAHQALAPVVDVARDARWGRVEETYGEDPYLVGKMGVAAVRGLQGNSQFCDKKHVIATLKHFAAHGQPESGMNCAPTNVSMRVLRETFLYPFKEAVQRGGAISVMPSYNEIDGVPSHVNRWLLRDVLRKEWKFKGFLSSDYFAIWELNYRPDTHGHFVAADKKEACALAVEAGVNLELPDPDCYLHLAELVRNGRLSECQLDELVAPMLLWKFKFGLFEDPYVDADAAESIVGCEAHRKLALRGAREAITLLRNDGNLLPLDPDRVGRIAVIGPNAHRVLLGGYSGVPKYNVSVLDGIKCRIGSRAEVLYSEGCKITVGGSWNQDEVVPSNPDEDCRQINEAVEVAKHANVIVLAIGGNEQTSRESWARNHMGDNTSLDLIGRQEDLVRALLALGKPIIVLLFNGQPISINFVSQQVPAILECWYLGQETGHAVADVLFGNVNPAGKLPITIPRSSGHLPVFYNYKPSARRGYLFSDASPLYAFGYGLSYTTFEFHNLRLTEATIKPGGSTRALVDLTNTGKREGTEVVQMYIRDRVSSVTRPVKELKGFKRVQVKPGETKTVELDITPDSLAFYDLNMEFVVEPGEFEIMVGSSSRDCDLQRVVLTVEQQSPRKRGKR